ncbi:hypothetical protein [Mycoplasmoides gallisepticum]|nr:hypothetical protein [Mycoplasmoides gallisepticum]
MKAFVFEEEEEEVLRSFKAVFMGDNYADLLLTELYIFFLDEYLFI